MYKKAARLKLRFKSKYGQLPVEQLWDLKLADLKVLIKEAHGEVVKLGKSDDDLSFLDGPTVAESEEVKIAQLKFEILKDIFVTRQSENKEAIESEKKKKEITNLAEILERKKQKELENLSIEELEKLIAEKSK